MIPRILFSTLLIPMGIICYSQDTTFFDKYNKTIGRNSAFYYQIQHVDNSHQKSYVVESFYMSGAKKDIQYYADEAFKEPIGIWKKWHPNNQLKEQETFVNGKLNDTLFTYWDDGQLKRTDLYDDGKFITGDCYNSQGKKISYFDYEQMPKYPGGDKSLMRDIYLNIKMPQIIRDKFLKVKVVAKFSVDSDGVVGDFEMISGSYPEVNSEVKRVLLSLKKWKPDFIDGEPVKVWYTVPLTFETKYYFH